MYIKLKMYTRLKAFDGKCALRIKKEIFNIRFKAIVDTCALEIKNQQEIKSLCWHVCLTNKNLQEVLDGSWYSPQYILF